MNQCDGCRSGYSVRKGIHQIPYPGGWMVCTRDWYLKKFRVDTSNEIRQSNDMITMNLRDLDNKELFTALDASLSIVLDDYLQAPHVPTGLIQILREVKHRLVPHAEANLYKDLYEKEGKIHAIKMYRQNVGCGLKEAKENIDRLAKENDWRLPRSRL